MGVIRGLELARPSKSPDADAPTAKPRFPILCSGLQRITVSPVASVADHDRNHSWAKWWHVATTRTVPMPMARQPT